EAREAMQTLLADIQSGKFADEWTTEYRCGMPHFRELRNEAGAHPIEAVGTRLRGLMPWLAPNRPGDRSAHQATVPGGPRIAREGWAVIGVAAGVLGPVAAVGALAGHPIAVVPLLLGVGFCFYFFRDPEREPPAEERLVVSPADGRVLDVVDEPE